MGNITTGNPLTELAQSEALAKPIANLTTPIATSAGKTLEDVWDLVFGGFGVFVEKKRLTRAKALEEFKSTLDNKVADIPTENLTEPQLSILGPALEAAKYYYEEAELREMFANLVAGSMDSRVCGKIHPCFVEIIKQLSPNDAKLLSLFKLKESLPVCELREISRNKKDFNVTATNVFYQDEYPNWKQNQISLNSLERTALIKTDYFKYLSNKKAYDRYYELFDIKSENKRCGWERLEIQEGMASLTPLGDAFISVCL